VCVKLEIDVFASMRSSLTFRANVQVFFLFIAMCIAIAILHFQEVNDVGVSFLSGLNSEC
jgi:hypothetical protein